MIRTQLQSLGLQLLLHIISSDRQLSCYQHLTLTQLYREREGTGCTSLHHPLSIVGSHTTKVSSFSLLPQSFSSPYQGAAIWRLGWIPCSESHTQNLGSTPPWVMSAQQTPFAFSWYLWYLQLRDRFPGDRSQGCLAVLRSN